MADVIEFQPSQQRLEEILREWGCDDDDIRANREHHGGKIYLSPQWVHGHERGFQGGHCNGVIVTIDPVIGEVSLTDP
jgi:hypothetical protein